MERHCTMPNIPWFKAWFEKRFGDLCRKHDAEYAFGKCKLCADFRFCKALAQRGHKRLSLLVFLAINLPHVWIIYYWRKL